MILSLIAAVARGGVIGAGNRLPWRIPGDLRRFKETTLGRPCLMGRKTFESLGRPLPGRENWVVTRDPSFRAPPGVEVRASLEDALSELSGRNPGEQEVFCIGGGELYRQCLSRADRLYLTEVDVEVRDADAFFPAWERGAFREESREEGGGEGPPHRFLRYARTEMPRDRKDEALYRPTLAFCLEQLAIPRKGGPVTIGISASQGAGKTTLAGVLVERLRAEGIRALSLSIDDFYLTRAEQVELARAHPGNPFLQERGYPGTHDLRLGSETLRKLKALRAGEAMPIPLYNKSAYGGKGDRFPPSEWKTAEGPLDVLLFDGWMLGFRALPDAVVPEGLREVNALLRGYEAWWGALDALIHLEPRDPRLVLQWRVEAEERMKASGKDGMPREEIERYVRTFLPAYELYLPGLSQSPPVPRARRFHRIIEEDRLPRA